MAETKPPNKASNSGRVSFPQKVYNVLKFAEENHQEHIISWMDNGTALRVHDVEEFQRGLLPRYFNTQKYSTFTRTLCAHGFHAARTGRQTGIYYHPIFNRNDAAAVSLMKRVKNKNTAIAAVFSGVATKGISNLHYGVREGNRMITTFPSLLDNPRSNEDDNPSAFGQLYKKVRSRLADTTTKMLVRLPPGPELVSPFDSENECVDLQPSPGPISQSSSDSKSRSFHMGAATTNTDCLRSEQVTQNYPSILDSDVAPMPESSRSKGYASDQEYKSHLSPHTTPDTNDGLLKDGVHDDDLEPIPWSPQNTPLHDDSSRIPDHSICDDEILLSSLEPRSIEEMKQNPDNLNAWYTALPMFPQPRYQALYDYSSPIILPGLFFYMDISTFGKCWAIFLIAGHTFQSLFTDYGANTRNLVWSPRISTQIHLFMDVIWVNSLSSAMILVPEYFGKSSVMLATGILSTSSLGISLKSHYHFHSQNRVPFIHGQWWIADIIRWLFLGNGVSLLIICLGHYYSDFGNLKVIGVFLVNLTPLFACQSYRLLLSIPTAELEHQNNSDKKSN